MGQREIILRPLRQESGVQNNLDDEPIVFKNLHGKREDGRKGIDLFAENKSVPYYAATRKPACARLPSTCQPPNFLTSFLATSIVSAVVTRMETLTLFSTDSVILAESIRNSNTP